MNVINKCVCQLKIPIITESTLNFNLIHNITFMCSQITFIECTKPSSAGLPFPIQAPNSDIVSSSLFQSKDLSDAIIKAKDKDLPAHKLVLSGN